MGQNSYILFFKTFVNMAMNLHVTEKEMESHDQMSNYQLFMKYPTTQNEYVNLLEKLTCSYL
jgi:hypothetical protein